MNKDQRFDRDKLREDESFVRAGFWDKLRKTLGRIPFVEDALAAYYCATDKASPLYVRALLMGALAYFIIPSDVIPDFIVGLGFTDDASVLAAAMAAVHSALKPAHYAAAKIFLDKQAPPADDEDEDEEE
jgi:uncharacterized membrane protein YkvA (DUF1232 family)